MKKNNLAKWTVAIALALSAGTALAAQVCVGRFKSNHQLVGFWCCDTVRIGNCGYVEF